MELLLVAILVVLVLAAAGLVVIRRRRETTLEPTAPPEAPPAEVEAPAPVEAAVGARRRSRPPPSKPRFRDRLGKARSTLSGYMGAVLARDKIDRETWDDLEEALIRADVGVARHHRHPRAAPRHGGRRRHHRARATCSRR